MTVVSHHRSRAPGFWFLVLAGVGLMACGSGRLGAVDTVPAEVQKDSRATAKPEGSDTYMVVDVFNRDESAPGQNANHTFTIGSSITVLVQNFTGWLINEVDEFGFVDDDLTKGASPTLLNVIRNSKLKVASQCSQVLDAMVQDVDIKVEDATTWAQHNTLGKHRKKLEKEAPRKATGTLIYATVLGKVLDQPAFACMKDLFSPGDMSDDAKVDFFRREVITFDQRLRCEKARQCRLLIDGIPLEGVNPSNPLDGGFARNINEPDDDYFRYVFDLTETERNAPSLALLRKRYFFARPVTVTLDCPIRDSWPRMETQVVTDSWLSRHPEMQLEGNARGHATIEMVNGWSFSAAVAILLLALVIFLFFASTTDLIRDPHGVMRPDGVMQYSLARFQMAFWFLLVVASALFLWVSLAKVPQLNETCLWLIGIGTGTALGAAAISGELPAPDDETTRREEEESAAGGRPLVRQRGESRLAFVRRLKHAVWRAALKKQDDAAAIAAAEAAQITLATLAPEEQTAELQRRTQAAEALKVQAVQQDAARTAADTARWQAMTDEERQVDRARALSASAQARAQELALLKRNGPLALEKNRNGSSGVFRQYADLLRQPGDRLMRLMDDWLTEDGRYSFHRYQMLVWTLVLGLIFVVSVARTRTLPTFDNTLLALLGITNGTYLGFRLKKPAPPEP